MKKHYRLLIYFAATLISCKTERDESEGYTLSFRPRTVGEVFVDPRFRKLSEYDGLIFTDYKTFEGNSVAGNEVIISIVTSNVDLRIIWAGMYPGFEPGTLLAIYYPPLWDGLDEHDPYIETQIENDYRISSRASMSRSSSGEMDFTHFVSMEYRTTEIRGLTLSALNAPLFGRSEGALLNDCFDIVRYEPMHIVSAPTRTLLYGRSSKDAPSSIGEWLSLNPMAQPAMLLFPNRAITGLPLDVQFVVQMQTADGTVLRDTTRMITLTP